MIKKINKIFIGLLLMFTCLISVNAASASISVSSSTSKVVVGNSFSVTIKISSSTALGSWEFTPNYDKSKLKLVSGTTPVVGYSENAKTKYKSYSYTFKALATGSATISLKSVGAYAWDESKLSVSSGSKTIKIITQAELEASYSKDNYLKSLSVENLKLSPTFSKSTTSYTVSADANTTKVTIKAKVNDSKSKLTGTGTFDVSEGENKFNITVTAQNGSTRKYTIIVNVTDPNPININIDGKEYTVIKRESLFDDVPNNFTSTDVKISDQEVPGFHNDINDFTIIGVKNEDDEVAYVLCDDGNYSFYSEVKLNQLEIYPLPIEKTFNSNYNKSTTVINDIEFESLQLNVNGYSIIHAMDLATGEENYYLYDSVLNTITRYFEEKIDNKEDNKIEDYKLIIFGLICESVLLFLIIIAMLIGKIVKNKKLRTQIEIERKKQEELLAKLEEQKENKQNKKKTKKKNIKKEGNTDEKEKQDNQADN